MANTMVHHRAMSRFQDLALHSGTGKLSAIWGSEVLPYGV